jgi:hypothetical protein
MDIGGSTHFYYDIHLIIFKMKTSSWLVHHSMKVLILTFSKHLYPFFLEFLFTILFLMLYCAHVNSFKIYFFGQKVQKSVEEKMSKILSTKLSKPCCQKEYWNCVRKNIKIKVSKIASVENVQKHSIKNGVLKSLEYFVENKVSKKMSKWYQYKCLKPSCQKKCQNGVKKILNIFVLEIYLKKSQNQHPILVVENFNTLKGIHLWYFFRHFFL